MNNSGKTLKQLTLLALSLGLALPANAQEMPTPSKTNVVTASDPKFVELQSPDVNVGGANKKFRAKDWLEIEVALDVKKWSPKPQDDYIDSLTIKWWIVVKGQDRKTYLMEKTVQHINIPVDEPSVVSVYLSPNTLKRITGKDGGGKSDLEAVGGQVDFGGEMVGFFSHGKKAGWWVQDLGSVERTSKFPLLNKDETPFKTYWYDRYAEILPKK